MPHIVCQNFVSSPLSWRSSGQVHSEKQLIQTYSLAGTGTDIHTNRRCRCHATHILDYIFQGEGGWVGLGSHIVVTSVWVTLEIVVEWRVMVDVCVALGNRKSVQNWAASELWITLITLRTEDCKQMGIELGRLRDERCFKLNDVDEWPTGCKDKGGPNNSGGEAEDTITCECGLKEPTGVDEGGCEGLEIACKTVGLINNMTEPKRTLFGSRVATLQWTNEN